MGRGEPMVGEDRRLIEEHRNVMKPDDKMTSRRLGSAGSAMPPGSR
jgi:hypothetical protein